jgi:hypothetical protein
VVPFVITTQADAANLHAPATITSCGNTLVSSGKYTLGSNISTSGTCLTITSNGVVLDGGNNGSGGHFTITGNVYGNGINFGDPGFNFTLQNITVTGITTSNGSGDVGDGYAYSGGSGGTIIISTSTIGTVTASGGDSNSGAPGGSGGSITIATSTIGTVTAIGGDGNGWGAGGTITIKTSTTGVVTADGGDGGTITIATSTTGAITADGDGDGNGWAPGGTITISTSTTGAVTASGGDAESGSGGTITIATSTTGTVTAIGGSNGWGGGGSGGTIIITGTSLNLSGLTISAAGGVGDTGDGYSNGIGGTLTLNYTTLNHTSLTLSTLSDLTLNGPGNQPGDLGSFGGGILILPGDTITTASQCSNLALHGTYTLSGSFTGDCYIKNNNVILNGGNNGSGGHFTITGNVYGNGINAGDPGFNFTLQNITVTGTTTSDGSDGGDIPGGSGGIITIATSTIGTVTAIGGDGNGWGNGGSGGTIIISTSNTGTLTAIGGDSNSDNGIPGGSGGSITIATSTTGTVTAGGGYGYDGGGSGGTITISTSTTGTVTASGGPVGPGSGYGGSGGSITIATSTTGAVTAIGGDGNDYNNGGSGGSITIATSTTGAVAADGNIGGGGGIITISTSNTGTLTADGGDGSAWWNGGSGGSITIATSTTGTVAADGGNDDQNGCSGGNGGTITITGTSLNLSGLTISAVGGLGDTGGGGGNGTDGTLALTYTSVITNTSTFFYNISDLTINNVSYGPWNGVFNPTIYYYNNAKNDGDWATLGNWWTDSHYLIQASSIPIIIGSGQVFINGNLTTDSSGTADADTVVFNGTSVNGIDITAPKGVTFNASSENASTGTITGNAIFEGDASNDNGTVTGTVTRLYTSNVTTTRNFTTEGNRNDWIVIAQGVVVNLVGATYNTSHDVFEATNGGSFVTGSNLGGQVVPQIAITEPTSGTVTKWTPSINWDTSQTCVYSYDNFATTHTVTCANNGSDIPRPSAGSHTLYLRGTDAHGSIAETAGLTFTYDNTVPIYTSCGTDLLDEATRPYYYLTGPVTGNCVATVNTELRGALSTTTIGYTVNGNVIATSSTNGLDITLKNIGVTGSIIANGANNTGTGYNGGTITISTSTTGAVLSGGGNGTTEGGNGGIINIINSFEVASNTPVVANGGDATVCGHGGNGGTATLTNSTYGAVSLNAGSDQTTFGAGLCISSPGGSSGSSGSPVITGTYTPPESSGNSGDNSNNNTNTQPSSPSSPSNPSSGSSGNFYTGLLPVNTLNSLNLQPLPQFNLGLENSSSSVGVTNFGNVLAGLQPVGSLKLKPLPQFSLESYFSAFLFSPLSVPATQELGGSPQLLAAVIMSIPTDQALLNSEKKPVPITVPEKPTPPGFFSVSDADTGLPIPPYITSATEASIDELVHVAPGEKLVIKVLPISATTVRVTFQGKAIPFSPVEISLTASTTLGRYTLSTTASPMSLIIQVVSNPPPSTPNAPAASPPQVKAFRGLLGWISSMF